VYFSGWVEYEIDNPNALGDASASTPDEIDPEGKSNLRSVPQELYRIPSWALMLGVGKRFRMWNAAPTDVPGATYKRYGGINFSLQPPAAQQPPGSA
jgi:hypothetical protein